MDVNNPYSAPTATILEPVSTTHDMEVARRENIRHEVSLKSIGTLYGLGALMMGLGILTSLSLLISGDNSIADQNRMLFIGMSFFYAVMSVILIVMAYGFRKLSSWVKIPGTLFAIIGLLGFPVGTLINGYILYLIWCKKGQTVLGPGYQDIISATPHVRYRRTLGDKIAIGIVLALLVGFVVFVVISMNA